MSSGRILIVEDDADLRSIYSLILTRSGYEVCESSNGEEGLVEVEECQPKLVLLDIFMPVMDGKTFLQKLDMTSHPNMKVLVCSNTSDNALLSDMLELGADKVVTKSNLAPSDLTDLVKPYMTTAA